ncbi:bifunctional enoyl-CoA hydratase/phosphate acetyltransferase [Derxia gummosa]|uniref:Bifunctional enoyl-CoA hydratase/phosphate acetyltransferase n=1 Tax=Derxia gummosa DSM 723 TaxID=1121388 RepID=A0A8B6XBW0_9BURK|nr:bifunctional enoyl-CoA hydratase/phosphate acetyltransferase [Derxia gummosa]
MDIRSTDLITNRTWDEIAVGDTATLVRTLTADDIRVFAAMSGDVNPAHLDAEYAKASVFHEVIAHGMWGAALISALLGTEFPGPGTIYTGQSLHFLRPVHIGDVLTVKLTAKEKVERGHRIVFDCECSNQNGEPVITGEAEVKAPTERISRPRWPVPDLIVNDRHARLAALVGLGRGLAPVSIAVAHPCDTESLKGALDAAEAGLVLPILVAPLGKLREVAAAAGLSLDGIECIDVPHSHAAAEQAVALVRAGRAEALMKGSLHTDELMHAVVAHDTGLRTARRLSHVFVMDVPTYPRRLLITDAAINIEPTLEDKADILRNAIDLARALGIATPKAAILAAVETVNPKMRATLDAAALCKMADRGQIAGAVLDGPLAFDNAISAAAAKTKGIVSPVAGEADILLVPDLESGNMLAKQLEYLADAQAAGIVLGAKVPIVLTSRADDAETRLASCVLALLLARAGKGGAGGLGRAGASLSAVPQAALDGSVE